MCGLVAGVQTGALPISWVQYIDDGLVAAGLVSPQDHELYLVTDDVDAAVDEIDRFWRTYHSIRWVGDRLVVRLRHAPTEAELAELNETFGDLLLDGAIPATEPLAAEVNDKDHLDLARIVMRYDPRRARRLRRLINALNLPTRLAHADTHRQAPPAAPPHGPPPTPTQPK